MANYLKYESKRNEFYLISFNLSATVKKILFFKKQNLLSVRYDFQDITGFWCLEPCII